MNKEVRENNPKASNKEIYTIIGKMWTELSDAKRQKFNAKVKGDKLRQEEQWTDLLTQGFFIM